MLIQWMDHVKAQVNLYIQIVFPDQVMSFYSNLALPLCTLSSYQL